MSRKPTIKLSYPDASTLAMQLTDAMIRRAPGKRILETTSEDKAGNGEGSLLDGLNSVRTSTGVEMTLTLEANSMDYALEQLIRPNLTEEEKKSIFGEESTSADEMLPGSAPAEEQTAPDQEKQIEIGKIPDSDLRTILADLVDAAQGYVQGGQDAWEKHIENAIETAIKEIDHRAGVIDLAETYEYAPAADLEKIILEALQDHIPDADYITKTGLMSDLAKRINLHEKVRARNFVKSNNYWAIQIAACLINAKVCRPTKKAVTAMQSELDGIIMAITDDDLNPEFNVINIPGAALKEYLLRGQYYTGSVDPKEMADLLENGPLPEDREDEHNDPSWDDVEAEARSMGKKQDQDIEPGLLNDLDDGSDGMAPAEEVMGHDE